MESQTIETVGDISVNIAQHSRHLKKTPGPGGPRADGFRGLEVHAKRELNLPICSKAHSFLDGLT